MCARVRPFRSKHAIDSWAARSVLIAVIVVTTVYAVRANNNGVDFANNVWGPARGLLSGRNPYDPANSSYLRRYDLSLVGGLYTPSVLLLHLPLAALSKARASGVIAVLDALLVWAGVLLLVRPRSSESILVATLLGALLVASATVQDSVAFGQIAPWAFFGFALLVRTIAAPFSPWWPALGVVLISLKPQSLLPVFVVLTLLAAWGVMLRALALIAATSLPGLALLLHAAGSPAAVGRTVRDNLRYFAHIPEDDLHVTEPPSDEMKRDPSRLEVFKEPSPTSSTTPALRAKHRPLARCTCRARGQRGGERRRARAAVGSPRGGLNRGQVHSKATASNTSRRDARHRDDRGESRRPSTRVSLPACSPTRPVALRDLLLEA